MNRRTFLQLLGIASAAGVAPVVLAKSAQFRPAAIPPLPIKGASRVYSAGKRLTNYGGPLVRVRRAGDNTELDVYEHTDVRAFLGDSEGYTVVMYDQSVNGNHRVQRVAAAQSELRA